MAKKDVRVYMFCGFLESGKTEFIIPAVGTDDFTGDERTLLLVTEEGEREYNEKELTSHNVRMIVFEDKEDFTLEELTRLDKEYRPTQVLIEWNGMWQVPEISDLLPEGWNIYQIVTNVNAETFEVYSKNMAQLMMQHISNADMVIFNRCTAETAEMLRGRNMKMLNRRAEMFLEYADGRSEPYDNGLPPFDLTSGRLDLTDDDYGVWFVDAMDNPDRYENITVSFLGQIAKSPKFPRGTCACGRFAMVCCSEDTAFLAVLLKGDAIKKLKTRDWVKVTATVKSEHVSLYKAKGPVLYLTDIEPAEKPEQELVTF